MPNESNNHFIVGRAVVLLLALSFHQLSYSQKHFEGTVTYTIEYDWPEDREVSKTMYHTEEVYTFKGAKFKSKFASFVGDITLVTDIEEVTAIFTVYMHFDTVAEVMTLSQWQKKNQVGTGKLIHTKEKKEIAGYTCMKAFKVENDDTLTVWYTKELRRTHHPIFGELPGVPLQLSFIQENGFRVNYTATEVIEQKIDDLVFEIPEDAEIKVYEEPKPPKEVEPEWIEWEAQGLIYDIYFGETFTSYTLANGWRSDTVSGAYHEIYFDPYSEKNRFEKKEWGLENSYKCYYFVDGKPYTGPISDTLDPSYIDPEYVFKANCINGKVQGKGVITNLEGTALQAKAMFVDGELVGEVLNMQNSSGDVIKIIYEEGSGTPVSREVLEDIKIK